MPAEHAERRESAASAQPETRHAKHSVWASVVLALVGVALVGWFTFDEHDRPVVGAILAVLIIGIALTRKLNTIIGLMREANEQRAAPPACSSPPEEGTT